MTHMRNVTGNNRYLSQLIFCQSTTRAHNQIIIPIQFSRKIYVHTRRVVDSSRSCSRRTLSFVFFSSSIAFRFQGVNAREALPCQTDQTDPEISCLVLSHHTLATYVRSRPFDNSRHLLSPANHRSISHDSANPLIRYRVHHI